VVIGIIALLISILLPALTKAKRSAVQVQCGSNLHNVGIALLNYAGDNKGKLPQFLGNSPPLTAPNNAVGAWIWDMEVGVRNALVHYGASRLTLYCPRNIDAMNEQGLWDYNVTPLSPTSGPPPGASGYPNQAGYSVMGFVYLMARADGAKQDNVNFPYPSSDAIIPGVPAQYKWNYQQTTTPHNTAYPTNVMIGGIARPNVASQTEIVCDATISTGIGDLHNVSFGNIVGGYIEHHSSAHWYGGLPVGGNILFLDGHTEWRPFGSYANTVMKPRVQISSTVYFWW
jgi:prepilin-type processing-associated H-X9-DG protein